MNWTPTQQENLLILVHRRGERLALEGQLTSLKKTLEPQRTQQETLRTEWDDEQADVNRLERLSWATIYYNLLSRHGEQLTKEKEEAQRARLDYDAITASVAALTSQIESLQNKLLTYADMEKEYDQLMRDKEKLVQDWQDATYKEHVAQLTAAEQHLTESTEARLAGREAIEVIDRLLHLLKEAHGWGQWDMFSDSAMFSMMKYSSLDQVRDQADRVRASVDRFGAELGDIQQQLQTEWAFDDGGNRFVDIFFDNIFTDMAVQQRIEKAQRKTQLLRDQVKTALNTVVQAQEQAQVDQAKRAHELRTYLEQAS